MADRDDELMQLRARVAELEARPSAGDLDWLKNSRVWKRAEFAASPLWWKLNAAFIALVFFVVFGIPIFQIIRVIFHGG